MVIQMDYKKITVQIQNLLKKEFKEGDLIITYRESGIPGQMTPFFIRSSDKIDLLSITPYCINNLAVYLAELTLLEVFESSKKGRVILTIKPCDMPSVLQMISDAQIPREKVLIIIFECDFVINSKAIRDTIQDDFSAIEMKQDTMIVTTMQKGNVTLNKGDQMAGKCKDSKMCDLPGTSDYYFVGTEKKRINQSKKISLKTTLVQDTLKKTELKQLVESELSKCIRCNACRNICPACFCSDQCIMDKPKLISPFIEKEVSLRNNILYHLIRFYHVAPNCTGCSECERVCPQNIKLSIFFKYLNRFIETEFGFEPGKSDLDRQKLLNYRFGEDLV
jgi:formate dehydrogenase subunit beta